MRFGDLRPQAGLLEQGLGDEGRALLYWPFENYSDGNLDAVRSMLCSDRTVSGLSDGGAHVGTICDASFPTFLLTHWARDRRRGEHLPIGYLVQTLVSIDVPSNAILQWLFAGVIIFLGGQRDLRILGPGKAAARQVGTRAATGALAVVAIAGLLVFGTTVSDLISTLSHTVSLNLSL